jgi:membrane glycosyltransferase
MGASAYFTSPMWLLLLIAALVHHYTTGTGVAPSPWLLGATVIILFVPKFLAMGWVMADAKRAEGFGRRSGVVASVMLEIPLSILVAPLMMMTQTLTLLDILRGRPSGWAPQRREVDGIAASEALRHYRPHLITGAAMAGLAVAGGGALAWMMPVAVGLFASPFIAAITSRADGGDYLAEGGVFMIPEEVYAERLPLLVLPDRRPVPQTPLFPRPAWVDRLPPSLTRPIGMAGRTAWRWPSCATPTRRRAA